MRASANPPFAILAMSVAHKWQYSAYLILQGKIDRIVKVQIPVHITTIFFSELITLVLQGETESVITKFS